MLLHSVQSIRGCIKHQWKATQNTMGRRHGSRQGSAASDSLLTRQRCLQCRERHQSKWQ
eukprot:28758_2